MQALLPADPGEEVVQRAAGDRHRGHTSRAGGRPRQAWTGLCYPEDGRAPEVNLEQIEFNCKDQKPRLRVKSLKSRGLLTVNRAIAKQWSVSSTL